MRKNYAKPYKLSKFSFTQGLLAYGIACGFGLFMSRVAATVRAAEALVVL